MLFVDHPGNKQGYCEALERLQATLFPLLRSTYVDDVNSKLLSLKICNLLAAQYHFHHRHTTLASRPVQLLIDPANGCQLRCPGCIHSANVRWSADFDWPGGMLSVEQAREVFDQFGPFACAAVFYNYGEPLLNKEFPEIVSAAKEYALFTMTSTNLALPIDAERLVGCGLDRLTISADGATQTTYERFRRGGRLSLVLDNIAALVEAKRRLNSEKPYLVWQYLTFEHNTSEVDRAIALARELGVNEIHVVTPFAVDQDDPTMKVSVSGQRGSVIFRPASDQSCCTMPASVSDRSALTIDSAFQTPLRERLLRGQAGEEESRFWAPTCRWLYHSLTVDAVRRIMPCCVAPTHQQGPSNLVYGRFDGRDSNVVNCRQAVLSRQAIAEGAMQRTGHDDPPYCIRCVVKARPPYAFNVADHIRMLDVRAAVPNDLYQALRLCTLYQTPQGAA